MTTLAHGGGHRREEHGDMRPFGDLIPFDEALRRCLEESRPVEGVEVMGLREALGRVAAEDVLSPMDVPPVDRSAMDGYAVRAADTRGATEDHPVALECLEVLDAATVPQRVVRPATCVQVATGSTMPPGADAVVVVERSRRRGSTVEVSASVDSSRNVAPRGQDMRRGDVVVSTGTALQPPQLGAVAGVGLSDVRVFRRPRVAILSTGDEVVAPGRPLRTGQIYDINTFTLASLVASSGGMPLVLPQLPDDLEALETSLRGHGADLLVFTGGSSVGAKDLVADLVGRNGRVIFHGVAVKPGKPTLLGEVSGVTVLGMPGFPTSCLSNGYVLLRPMVRRMAHLPQGDDRRVSVPLAVAVPSSKGRTDVVTVRVEGGVARPAFKESSSITSMAWADGYFLIPAEVIEVAAGAAVDVTLF